MASVSGQVFHEDTKVDILKKKKKKKNLTSFFNYNTEIFPFQNNPKLSFGLFWKGKTCVTAKFYVTDLVIYNHA